MTKKLPGYIFLPCMLSYEDLMKLKSKGTAILLVSVELDEIMSLSDRIVVMNQGTIVGETNSSNATELDLGKMMSGLEQV